MFVFGEVQDPLPETTHLVEDIVRGQIVEIVRCQIPSALNCRSLELDPLPTSADPASCLQKTSFSSFAMTGAK